MTRPTRQRFHGRIAGIGSSSGIRVVLGHWHHTPLGVFSDAMIERPDGHRVLVAPSSEVADFIAATYRFDEIRIQPFAVTEVLAEPMQWQVRSASLTLDLTLGARTPLGRVLRLVPRHLARTPAWCAAVDPVARVAMRGVRTRGSAAGSRREWYGAVDTHRLVAASGRFDGASIGELAPVDPPCRFGFSSVPRRPSVTTVVTTVEVPAG